MGRFKWDEVIAVGLLGVVIMQPSIATTINSYIAPFIPATWNWFGTYTNAILGGLVGGLIGYIVGRS